MGDTARMPQVYAHEALLTVAPGADPRAPGGAITVELCGSWPTTGRARWPRTTPPSPARAPSCA
ncbi:hypothetical protein GCM10009790_02170 [Georgenia ruanii]